MAFTDSHLREVADELGRRYNLEFEIDDARLAAVPVTITITDGTVQHALTLLSQTVAGLQYKIDGREVRLFRQ